MTPLDHPQFDQHEGVHFFHDAANGLQAIIAIHSTALGPAAGGCRLWQYATQADALTDALRLSRGMTYKNAMAGLSFGGGKAVILKDEKAPAGPGLFRAFGRAVQTLGGRYITAEDVGVSVADMQQVRSQTTFVSGLPNAGEAAGGDPSPWTAQGVFLGIQAALHFRLQKSDLKGVRVAVQGIGHVGMSLCEKLHAAGAQLTIADVNVAALNEARERFGATIVPIGEILTADVDVLAPCALGAVVNEHSIAAMQARVIAGAANNQLADDAAGELLVERDILYAPDYVINAGGIISVASEYQGGTTSAEVSRQVAQIPARLTGLFEQAARTGQSTNRVANAAARAIVASAAQRQSALRTG